jgi:glucokinase
VAVVGGIDLGGTKILGVAVDPEDPTHVLAEARVLTPRGAEPVVEALAAVAERLQDEVGPFRAVGVGAAGLVDRSGVLRHGPNLPGVADLDVAGSLGGRLGVPVAVDNDATCATWAEARIGAAAGARHAVLVTLGTGIGGGIIAEGRRMRGAYGFAGEPGHMCVDPQGPRCPCGRRGCWERFASGSGLARLARDAAFAGRIPGVVALAGGDAEDVRGEHVTRAAATGDSGAIGVMDDFGWWVALGVAALVNVLDPEVVVIGGGLVAAGDLLLVPTRAAYRDLVLAPSHRPPVEIRAAALGERAGAVGAALLTVDDGPG